MPVTMIPMGPLSTNGYFYTRNSRTLLIDPGGTHEEMIRILEQQGCELHAVLLTHGHFDHIMGLAAVRERFPTIPVYLHKADLPLYKEAQKQAAIFGFRIDAMPQEVSLLENEEDVEGMKVLLTPGHSPGSISFYDPTAATLFSGDTLFQYGVGRTDLWGGSWELLLDSIRNRLFALPAETVVYSGHGGKTTIGVEKRENPFVNGAPL